MQPRNLLVLDSVIIPWLNTLETTIHVHFGQPWAVM